ncbi:MAG: dTMP kinase [Anaerolineales bacterium]|jgi:dTMP kinase
MFITFEGPDGSGKTYQMALLNEYLKERGFLTLATREPGGTSIGDQIRAILNNLDNTSMHPRTEILLFQASRAQHVEQVILPHLKLGEIVLCDRFADSTLAYQGYGHRVELNQLKFIVEFATGGLEPDLTLLLDLDVGEGLQRREKGGDWNRLDAYDLKFHQRVREGYFELMKSDPERWVKIDASQSPAAVQEDIRRAVKNRVGNGN